MIPLSKEETRFNISYTVCSYSYITLFTTWQFNILHLQSQQNAANSISGKETAA